MTKRLVDYSHGAGCACKLGPQELAQVMEHVTEPFGDHPDLLVGPGTSDDAGVWRLDDERALIVTTDFFTPIVEDPHDWGRIAAANALSDVYAMGGRPLLCLNLAAWPRDALPFEMLGRVLDGGASVARAAGAFIMGGHTIDDPEPKYGMAVVGIAHPERIVTNAGARPGDALVLTKPVGIGVITTAIKNRAVPDDVAGGAIEVMTTLNAAAAQQMTQAGAHAATDVTGFGLLGHLREMLVASGVGATVHAGAVPILPGAHELIEAGQIAGGTRRNREHVEPHVSADAAVDDTDRWLLYDAQTSGGLLIACPPGAADGIGGARIGTITDAAAGSISLNP